MLKTKKQRAKTIQQKKKRFGVFESNANRYAREATSRINAFCRGKV